MWTSRRENRNIERRGKKIVELTSLYTSIHTVFYILWFYFNSIISSLHLFEYVELFYHEISRNKREKCKSKKNFLNRNVGNAWLFTRNVDWTGWKKSHNYCIDWYQFRECLWQCGDVTEKDKRYESSRIRRCIRMEQTESKGWLFWWACVISASILANGEEIWIIAFMPTETKLKIPNKWPILKELKYIFEYQRLNSAFLS